MKKEELGTLLQTSHTDFFKHIAGFTADAANTPKGDKWSPAEHLAHINKSVKPLVMALGLPKLAIAAVGGKANRPSGSFDDVVAMYKAKLDAGAKSSGTYEPKREVYNVPELIEKVKGTVDALTDKLSGWKEEDLDKYFLPHPLLGKLTVREMLYFTAYHVQYHHMLVKRDY